MSTPHEYLIKLIKEKWGNYDNVPVDMRVSRLFYPNLNETDKKKIGLLDLGDRHKAELEKLRKIAKPPITPELVKQVNEIFNEIDKDLREQLNNFEYWENAGIGITKENFENFKRGALASYRYKVFFPAFPDNIFRGICQEINKAIRLSDGKGDLFQQVQNQIVEAEGITGLRNYLNARFKDALGFDPKTKEYEKPLNFEEAIKKMSDMKKKGETEFNTLAYKLLDPKVSNQVIQEEYCRALKDFIVNKKEQLLKNYENHSFPTSFFKWFTNDSNENRTKIREKLSSINKDTSDAGLLRAVQEIQDISTGKKVEPMAPKKEAPSQTQKSTSSAPDKPPDDDISPSVHPKFNPKSEPPLAALASPSESTASSPTPSAGASPPPPPRSSSSDPKV